MYLLISITVCLSLSQCSLNFGLWQFVSKIAWPIDQNITFNDVLSRLSAFHNLSLPKFWSSNVISHYVIQCLFFYNITVRMLLHSTCCIIIVDDIKSEFEITPWFLVTSLRVLCSTLSTARYILYFCILQIFSICYSSGLLLYKSLYVAELLKVIPISNIYFHLLIVSER